MTQSKNKKNYNIAVVLFATAILITLYGGIKGSTMIMLLGILILVAFTPFYFKSKFSYYNNLRESLKKIMKKESNNSKEL